MPDLPDWTGSQALTAAPLILQAQASFILNGSTAQTIVLGLSVPAGRRVRLFGIANIPSQARFLHWIGMQLLEQVTTNQIGQLSVGPNQPVDREWYSPPYDCTAGNDLLARAFIQDGQGTDTEQPLMSILYSIVGV